MYIPLIWLRFETGVIPFVKLLLLNCARHSYDKARWSRPFPLVHGE